jgi:hypothetical protein
VEESDNIDDTNCAAANVNADETKDKIWSIYRSESTATSNHHPQAALTLWQWFNHLCKDNDQHDCERRLHRNTETRSSNPVIDRD